MGNGRPTCRRSPSPVTAARSRSPHVSSRPLLAASVRFLPGIPQRLLFTVGLDETTLAAVAFATALLPEPEIVFLTHARRASAIGASTAEVTATWPVEKSPNSMPCAVRWHRSPPPADRNMHSVGRVRRAHARGCADKRVGPSSADCPEPPPTTRAERISATSRSHLLADAECTSQVPLYRKGYRESQTAPNVCATETTQ